MACTDLDGALARFLRSGARPFAWGASDCCLWACDWVRLVRGVDPAEPLRGRYRTARGARLHLARAGGLLELARRRMADCGLVQTAYPRPGDVAVVETPWGEALAVRTAVGWAMKGEQGVAVMPFNLLQAWAV